MKRISSYALIFLLLVMLIVPYSNIGFKHHSLLIDSFIVDAHTIDDIESYYYEEPLYEDWNRTYGETQMSEGIFVEQTSDGGYVIGGGQAGLVGLIKTDDKGDMEWLHTFSGGMARGGQKTEDGGFILVGSKGSGSWTSYIWLIKTDNEGNLEWEKTIGNKENDNHGRYVQQTNDEGYIIAGQKSKWINNTLSYDEWLIKTDKEGNIEWEKTFIEESDELIICVKQTTDGGYIFTGDTFLSNKMYSWLVKLNALGNEEWNKKFNANYGCSVLQIQDGGYIVVGKKDFGIWLLKTDSYGTEEWNKTINADEKFFHLIPKEIIITEDKGYIIVGRKSSGYYEHDGLMLKTDNRGELQWKKTFGGYSSDFFNSIRQTTDNCYILTGYTNSFGNEEKNNLNSNIWLLKTYPVGYSDEKPPMICINKPLQAIYFKNQILFDFPVSIIIGSIDVKMNCSDNESGIKYVDLFINNTLIKRYYTGPYEWFWNEDGFGSYVISVIAYDKFGNEDIDEKQVWKFF